MFSVPSGASQVSLPFMSSIFPRVSEPLPTGLNCRQLSNLSQGSCIMTLEKPQLLFRQAVGTNYYTEVGKNRHDFKAYKNSTTTEYSFE